jgi:thiol:disulfide interchange protein
MENPSMKGRTVALAASTVAGALAILTASPRPSIAADDLKRHGPIAWTDSLPDALKTAAKQKKPIFIDFWAEWCGPCKEMLATTYTNPDVVNMSKRFVPVLINVEKQPELQRRFKFTAIPTIIFLDSKGRVLGQHTGRVYAPQFLQMMTEAQKRQK